MVPRRTKIQPKRRASFRGAFYELLRILILFFRVGKSDSRRKEEGEDDEDDKDDDDGRRKRRSVSFNS